MHNYPARGSQQEKQKITKPKKVASQKLQAKGSTDIAAKKTIFRGKKALISVQNFLEKTTCAVVGARGYSGLELARILLRHPKAKLTHCFATTDFQLSNYVSSATMAVQCLPDVELQNNLADVVFLATPAEVSLELAPQILAAGKKVIDLSGAFRLKHSDYKKWYNFEHSEAAALKISQYGLSPWVEKAKSAKLIANPGCYATAISMALIPLLKHNLISAKNIVIDAKSGTSGAGKKAAENLLFTEVEGDCLPYRIGRHQHLPEITECIADVCGVQIDPFMCTSLLPVRRGIIASIYCEIMDDVTEAEIVQTFEKAYGSYPLVSFGKATSQPGLMSLRKVVGTAKTHISYVVEGRKLYLFSCIDNLIKGAAGQAVENFNRMIGAPIDLGLDHLEAMT